MKTICAPDNLACLARHAPDAPAGFGLLIGVILAVVACMVVADVLNKRV